MNRSDLRLSDQTGFTLVELLVAMVVLLIGVSGTLAMLDRANATTVSNRAREAGTSLAREIVERARSLPYTSVTSTSVPAQLQATTGLADADLAKPGWQVNRRGTSFTIAVSACSVDDPNDGSGPHDAASWCAGGAAPSNPPDRNPDDYKRITIDVTWDQPDAKGRAHEQTLMNSPGNAAGPAITALTPTPPDPISCATPPCTSVTSVTFNVTTSATPATVPWSIDGADQGTASGSRTTWSFVWDLTNVTDGTYLIGVRAFDAQGRSGANSTKTMTLNRFLAAKPRGFAAGRNGAIVDAEWLANSERDIAGYRLYRQVGTAAATQVAGSCSTGPDNLTTKISCYDASPPPGTVVYFVRALDRDRAGALREGPSSDPVTVSSTSTPPGPVTSAKKVQGALLTDPVKLTWTAPAGTPAPAFYRIYRDGALYANRYDRTGSSTPTEYTDSKPGGEAHRYWITAVSANLAESPATEATP